MTKALREQPRATHALARTERLTSDDVTAPTVGSDLDFGKPLDDMAKRLFAPQNYFTASSALGPLVSALQMKMCSSRRATRRASART